MPLTLEHDTEKTPEHYEQIFIFINDKITVSRSLIDCLESFRTVNRERSEPWVFI
jgi:hypothetical protein